MKKLYFSGFCDKCSEVYEAQSRTDDLTGIRFKCKHSLCTGHVTLREGRPTPLAPHYQKRSIDDPRRFC